MKSWKTTLAGAALIVGTLADAVYAYATHGDLPNFATLFSALTAGAGLLAAKDHNVTNAPVPAAAKLAPLLALSALLLLAQSACSTTAQTKLRDAIDTPTGQAVIHTAETEALSIGTSLLFDAVNGGDFDAKSDAISGAVAGLRSIELTPAAQSAPAIADTVQSFTASRQLQPVLSQAVVGIVANAIAQGAPPSAALEAAAAGLETAVARSGDSVHSAR